VKVIAVVRVVSGRAPSQETSGTTFSLGTQEAREKSDRPVCFGLRSESAWRAAGRLAGDVVRQKPTCGGLDGALPAFGVKQEDLDRHVGLEQDL